MKLEFTVLGSIVFGAWLLGSTPMGFLSVLFAGAVIYSQSIPVNILFLISLTAISYMIAAGRSQKKFSGLMQLYFGSRLAFLFVALLGSALQGYQVAPLLVFFGLLGALPVFVSTAFLSRPLESLTMSAFLYSVLIPALTILNVLLKIKGEVKADWGPCWDTALMVLGLGTMILGTFTAFLKRKTKPLLIYLSLSWVGLGLVLLVMDADPLTGLALGVLSVFAFTTPALMNLGKQLGSDYERTARFVLIGAPGFLGFSMLYYAVRVISALNVNWIWPVAIAFVFQALAISANDHGFPYEPLRKVKFRFFLILMIQVLCVAGFYWAEKMGMR